MEKLEEFYTWEDINKASIALIMQVLYNIYIIILEYRNYGFICKTFLEFIEHFNDNYSNIIPGDIEENPNRINTRTT